MDITNWDKPTTLKVSIQQILESFIKTKIMPTGYTQQIIDGTVKTPKEFLHLCLRNFGVCISMRDMPLDTPQVDYTEYIKRYYQDTIGYYSKALENAKKEYARISNLSDDDLYEMYVKKFSDNREYYQKRTDEVKKQNAQYQSFYDVIKNWDCSEEFSNIKKFALDQIDISKDDEDYYADELSKEMLTKEEFISEGKYKEDLLKATESDVEYNQERLDHITKDMNDTLAFYERFKKEIDKL